MESGIKEETKNKQGLQQTCDIENFKMVAEHFRQDLREFWTRANFYLLAHTALLSAFVVVYSTLVDGPVIVAFLVPIFGIGAACFWFLVLRGCIYWIERWRSCVIRLSDELDRFKSYSEVEKVVNLKKSKSPSYLTQFLPLTFVAIWTAMLVVVILETSKLVSIFQLLAFL